MECQTQAKQQGYLAVLDRKRKHVLAEKMAEKEVALGNAKYIDGFDKRYLAFRDGRILSLYGKARFMKGYFDGRYMYVPMFSNKKRKLYLLHRVIAKTFIENKDMLPNINHIDGNKTNNNVNNLEWCTQKENVRHSINVLGRWANSPAQRKAASIFCKTKRKFDEDTVRKIRVEYSSSTTSFNKIAMKYCVFASTIRGICNKSTYKEII